MMELQGVLVEAFTHILFQLLVNMGMFGLFHFPFITGCYSSRFMLVRTKSKNIVNFAIVFLKTYKIHTVWGYSMNIQSIFGVHSSK